jgi:hypothetical protein
MDMGHPAPRFGFAWFIACVLSGGVPLACGAAFEVDPSDASAIGDGSTDRVGTDPDSGPGDSAPHADGASPPPPAEGGVAVSGKVVDALLTPVANATVRIQGAQATTDGTGAFSIPGVTLPYLPVVVKAGADAPHAYAFASLSRTDPTLQLLFDEPTDVREAAISGAAATGTTPGTAGIVFVDIGAGTPAASANSAAVTSPGGTYSGAAAWIGAASVSATFYDLQWFTLGDAGLPDDYIAYVSQSMTLTSGQSAMWHTPDSVTLSPGSLPATVDVSPGYVLVDTSLYLRPPGATIAAPIAHQAAPPSTVPFVTPGIGGATFVACALQAQEGTSTTNPPYGLACNTGLGGSQSTQLEPPPATVLVSPPMSAGLSTVFDWNAIANGVSLVAFEPVSTTTGDPSFYVLTDAASGSIPDLGAVGVGVRTGAAYTVSVYGFAPFAKMDDAVGPAGYGGMAIAAGLGQGPIASGQLAFSGSSAFETE